MKVYNYRSGAIALVRASSDGTLAFTDSWVPIRKLVRSGKRRGKLVNTEWHIKHVSIIPQSRDDLKPGMHVRNFVSNRTGIIVGHDDKLEPAADYCVVVEYRVTSGKRKGKKARTYWRLLNMIILHDVLF